MIGWERIQGGIKANFERWVLSFERNVETDNELRVSGVVSNGNSRVSHL